MTEAPEHLRVALADRYELQHELGRGGMATVYLAQDLRHPRRVALKVLHAEVAAALGRERFLREIAFVSQLSHPNILPLLDSGGAGEYLFYTMPCVEGETLRERIAREGQLPLADVVAIARDVAEGLACAHEHGIVHRDVKPANILLSGRATVLTDFGIARAVRYAADEDKLTATGITVGTPLYMAPEQTAGAPTLDGRADLYSLACVVYEMLAGAPPFTGSTAQAIQARHALDPPPPLHTVRSAVPPGVERAVLRALEKVPADRFPSVRDFADALAASLPTGERPVPKPPRRHTPLALAAVAAIGVSALVWITVGTADGGDAMAADTTRYAVLPFERQGDVPSLEEDERLADALSRWTGITVIPHVQVEEAARRRGGTIRSGRDAHRVASAVGAGRFVRGRISVRGDSVRIWAGLYGVAPTDTLLRQASVGFGARSAAQEAPPVFQVLADSLLFAEVRTRQRPVSWTGTRSAPARQAYGHGHAAIEEWELGAADSAFAAAVAHDPLYAQAHLWLAQVRVWARAPAPMWRSAAERAMAGRDRLGDNERVMADALVALSRGDHARACPLWRDLTRAEPSDFVAWYGLGNCLAEDEAVIRDPRSPSGRSYRTSYHEATRAYQRAYHLLPAMHKALSTGSYRSVQALLKTSTNMLRKGHAVPPDTGTFEAYASWQGDTLAFIPLRRSRHTPTSNLAVRRQRELFHEIAQSWVAAYPASSDAMLALALALEMLGDPAAIDTMRHAARLATTPHARVEAAAAEVWMRVRMSAPDDLSGLGAARVLADSVLRANPPPDAAGPIRLASLAALLGQASRAAAYMRETSVRTDWTIPGPIARSAAPLLVFAALGGPIDSLRALERDLATAIDLSIPAEEQAVLRAMWLGRAASLAFPHYRFATLRQLRGLGDYLVDAQAAFADGDTEAVQRMADSMTEIRRIIPPEQRTPDGVYPEAALLAEGGDTARAIAWLDPTLNAIAAMAPQVLDDPVTAGSLVRAMALRVDLARGAGDRDSARRWAAAVHELWGGADDFLQRAVGPIERAPK